MPERDENPLEVEVLEMLADQTARLKAATLELRKTVLWMREEQRVRDEIALLERWFT